MSDVQLFFKSKISFKRRKRPYSRTQHSWAHSLFLNGGKNKGLKELPNYKIPKEEEEEGDDEEDEEEERGL